MPEKKVENRFLPNSNGLATNRRQNCITINRHPVYLPRPLVNHFHIQVCWSLWSKDHVALFKSHVPRKRSHPQAVEEEWAVYV